MEFSVHNYLWHLTDDLFLKKLAYLSCNPGKCQGDREVIPTAPYIMRRSIDFSPNPEQLNRYFVKRFKKVNSFLYVGTYSLLAKYDYKAVAALAAELIISCR